MLWTQEEDAILVRERCRGKGWVDRVHFQLPHRTKEAIRIRGNKKIQRKLPWRGSREKGCLRPQMASLARARRRSAMGH